METTNTKKFTVEATHIPAIFARVQAVIEVANRLKVEAPKAVVVDREVVITKGEATEMATIEITYAQIKFAGGWNFVAVIDHQDGMVRCVPGTEEGVVMTWTGAEAKCDHCATKRDRNKTIVVKNEAGEVKQVGGSCVKDYLGHAEAIEVVEKFIWDLEAIGEDVDFNAYQTSMSGKGEKYTVAEVLVHAAATIDTFGFKPASFEFATRKIVDQMLFDRRGGKQEKNAKEVVVVADHVEEAKKVMEYYAGVIAKTDFEVSIKSALTSPKVSKNMGLIVYAVEGYRKAIAKEAQAQLDKALPVVDCPTGKTVVTGEIIRFTVKQDQFGVQYKITVRDDRGFTVYGTCPLRIIDSAVGVLHRDPRRGDRVIFTATLTPSDETNFGFFARPTKAELEGVVLPKPQVVFVEEGEEVEI